MNQIITNFASKNQAKTEICSGVNGRMYEMYSADNCDVHYRHVIVVVGWRWREEGRREGDRGRGRGEIKRRGREKGRCAGK